MSPIICSRIESSGISLNDVVTTKFEVIPENEERYSAIFFPADTNMDIQRVMKAAEALLKNTEYKKTVIKLYVELRGVKTPYSIPFAVVA